RRPRHQGIPQPHGGAPCGGGGARAAPPRAPRARGPRSDRAAQPGAAQQVLAPAHRGAEGRRRGGPRLRAARGATPPIRPMRSLVLVTGGAGYIGSVVADQLLARGRDVVVLDDLSTGHREAVPAGATFVQAGIGDRVAVTALFARYPVGAIVHMAAFALVAESVADPEKYRANNVAAAKVLLDEAVAAGVRRLVFSSSCTVYGYPSAVPIAEDAPLGPVSPYGETKLEFERLLATYAVQHRLSSVSLRYFNAAGATEQRGEDHDPESHLIPNLLGVALGKRPAAD